MAYDSAISSFTIKTDKVDLVSASHINTLQSEIVTIETVLGTNVKGNRTDLKTRLNNALDADGSMLSGTSYPSPALPSQVFYDTSLDTMYIRNAANTAWNSVTTLACFFSAYHSSTMDLTTSPSKVQFNTEDFDVGSNYDNATNYRFIAPTSGKYIFTFTSVQSNLTGEGCIVFLYKNGSVYRVIAGCADGSVDSNDIYGFGGSILVSAATSDYFEIYAKATGGSTLRIGSATQSNSSTFTGALLQGSF